MSIKNLTQDAVTEIKKAVLSDLSDSEAEELTKIIESKLVKAVKQSTKSCTSAAVIACGPESDLAHKIATEVNQARDALIANLKSMR